MKNQTLTRLNGALIASFCVAALLFGAQRAGAQANANPPGLMTYQGFLVDANGNPLGTNSPKNYDVIFRVWDAATAGNPVWAEQQTVTVDKGYFSVLLGEGSSIGEPRPALNTVFTNNTASDRWIGLTVKSIGPGGADANILPRLRLLASPYSFLAQKAVNAATVDGSALVSGTVPDARLSGNVALRTGGNTFSGNQLFTSGDLYMDNQRILAAKNSGGGYENVFWPRWSDNVMYMNFGTGGFNIRNNSSISRMFITDAGNVGIGTAGPAGRLQVEGGRLIVSGNAIDTSAFTGLGLQYQSSTGEGAIMSAFNDGYGFLSFYTKLSAGQPLTRRMTITTGGSVGIGTASPSYPLTVQNDSLAGLRVERSDGKYASMYRNSGGFGSSGQLVLQMNQSHWKEGDVSIAYDGDANWNFPSDRKLKKDIVDAEPMLERALQVQVRRFRWKGSGDDSKHMLGVIAQEVQPLFPDMVDELENPETKEKNLTVGYGDFAVVAIKALQEFKKQHDEEVTQLKAQLDGLKRENAELSAKNNEHDDRLAALERFVRNQQPQTAAITTSPAGEQN